jgi:chemotaxis response regulator CheB
MSKASEEQPSKKPSPEDKEKVVIVIGGSEGRLAAIKTVISSLPT